MSHVELVGPPGAGKTTVHSRLVEADEYFDGCVEDAVRRRILRNSRDRYKIPYRSMPEHVRSFVERKFIEPGFRRTAFDRFVSEQPRFLDILSLVLRSTEHESKWLYSYYKEFAEAYQLGMMTARRDEHLCLDEGFAQCAIAALWRGMSGAFPLDTYLKAVPMPGLLIHVTAPVDVCLDRQRERNPEDTWASVEWKRDGQHDVQREVHGACRLITDRFSERTNVVTVENTGSIEETLSNVQSLLSERPDETREWR